MALRCKLRLHKYGKKTVLNHFSSNIIDYTQYCLICGKKKSWNKPKPVDSDEFNPEDYRVKMPITKQHLF